MKSHNKRLHRTNFSVTFFCSKKAANKICSVSRALELHSQSSVMYDPKIFRFSKSMTKASLILASFVSILLVVQLLSPGDFSTLNIMLSLILELVWVYLLVLLIRLVRTEDDLGVMGYLWRCIVSKYLSLFVALFSIVAFFGSLHVPSIKSTSIILISGMLVSIFVVWVIFSKNRKSQLYWLLAIFRGY